MSGDPLYKSVLADLEARAAGKKRDLEVVETLFGKFQIQPGDGISDTTATGVLWDGAGFLQPLFKEHYVPGTTVIDIGANIGTFSVWCAHEGATRVIAVEPVPATLLMLKASLALNRFCDSVVIPLGIAAYDHTTYLNLETFDPLNLGATALKPVLAASTEKQVSWITAHPLDNYQFLFGSRVSFIKCDAQGSDLRALEGLTETIKRDAPFIVFEWEEGLAKGHNDTWERVGWFLSQVGYTCREWPTHPNNFVAYPLLKALWVSARRRH